ALDRLDIGGFRFTRGSTIPGGNVSADFNASLIPLALWMPEELLLRLARSYGTRLRDILGDATSLRDLGRHFGAGLYEREIRYLIDTEFAKTAEDIIWRRTKLGLQLTPK